MADTYPIKHRHTDDAEKRGRPVDAIRRAETGAADPQANPAPDPEFGSDEVRAALARLLASSPFCKSAQLANFLSFVVEETLAGRGGRIKAYTIATGALGRDETFDPQTDPIVRVEAARLRRALRAYYADGGADEAIVIELPTGAYMPVLRSRRPQRPTALTRLRQSTQELHALVVYARENRRLLLLIFGIAVVVSVIADLVDALILDRF